MADFSLNRKSLIVLILAGFVILKMYLNNDILQTDVDILLKKTISLQKEIKRLNADMDLIKIEQKSASSDFAQPRRQEAADSASTNNPNNNKVMDMIVDDLVNNINIFLKLNDSNATLLARLVLASLKIKVKFRFFLYFSWKIRVHNTIVVHSIPKGPIQVSMIFSCS
jgi:hypothetical protein